jgi:hypothetical protein
MVARTAGIGYSTARPFYRILKAILLFLTTPSSRSPHTPILTTAPSKTHYGSSRNRRFSSPNGFISLRPAKALLPPGLYGPQAEETFFIHRF